MLALVVALVVLAVAVLVVLAAAALVYRNAVKLRGEAVGAIAEARADLLNEREDMRKERAAWAEERMQLVARIMFVAGKPYEDPPIWARSDAPDRDPHPLDGIDEQRYVFPESMLTPAPAAEVEIIGDGQRDTTVWAGD